MKFATPKIWILFGGIIIICLIALVGTNTMEGLTNKQILSQLEQANVTTPPPDHDLNRYYYDPVQGKYVTRPPEQVLTSAKTPAPDVRYDLDNINVTYHEDVSSIMQKSDDMSNAGVGRMWIKDSSGQLVSVPYSDVSNTTLYYNPTENKYKTNYVPGYAEYVKLSKFSKSRINPPFMGTFDGSNYPADRLDLRPNLPDLPNVPAYTAATIWQRRIPETNIPYEFGLLT